MTDTPYRAPAWLPGGHLQTIWPLARRPGVPGYTRVRWETPDDDFIHADWLPRTRGAPLVVLFHGLEGSSDSHYARAIMGALAAIGWNGVVPNFRGCSGRPNRLLRAYHSGDSAEIGWILARIGARYREAPVYAVGVSLGGNALLKWLGEQGEDARRHIAGAAAICPPLDLTVSGTALGQGFNRIYTQRFLRTLKAKALDKIAIHKAALDADRIRRARTLYDFDDAFTAPVHGFDGVLDYWQRASSRPWLKHIATPTLLLNAANDPFVPPAALPQQGDCSPAITQELPAGGGHVGFLSGRFPGRLDWLPARLIAHFDSLTRRKG
ncbi:YheT family hydrolase [Denitromonas iodatirespirans]|uniref:Alpha/beta fold hydrolase n=1 Tax=Denitromonas iodatirespirans TaxID=2795389 RepID=A0A944DCJ6_DENI1|nr:alpha/beta fold hydrolase [Denitromonas iodatirespirans]MBT0962581.1 alpha/beta fold hydrolase [Denitromonas iodatirespirans]